MKRINLPALLKMEGKQFRTFLKLLKKVETFNKYETVIAPVL